MRIAGLLHTVYYKMCAPGTLLQDHTMKDAIQIGRYFLEHAKMAFRISGLGVPEAEKGAKYILKFIRERKIRKIRKKELFDICRGHFHTVEEMQPGLDELEERDYIRVTKQNTGGRGRPSEINEINPKYWERCNDIE